MNQTVITLFLLFFVSANLCGQESNSQLDIFFAHYKVDSLIDSKYDSIERIYTDSASYFLTKYKIENDSIEHSLYLEHIQTELEEFSSHTMRFVVYNFKQLEYDSVEVSSFISKHDLEIQNQIEYMIKKLVNENISAFRSMLPRYFETVSAKSKPLRLRMIVDEDTVINFSEDLIDIYAVIDNKNVDIFNNEKNIIKLESNYSYDSIQYLVIRYNNHDYEFFKSLPFNPPPDLKDSFEKGRKDNFNEDRFTSHLYWHVTINNKEEPKKLTLKTRNATTIHIK